MKSPVILVVEDNPLSMKMVRVALTHEGYTVLEAPDGQTALEFMRQQAPDLVLQDLVLPDIDGFELCRQLHAVPGAASTPILAFTGFLSKAEQAKSMAAEFTNFLYKPIEPSQLVQVVQSYIRPASPEHAALGRNYLILLADDDPVQRKLLQKQLEQFGFRITAVANGDEALAEARHSPPALCVTDVLMPGLDGFRLCLAIRQDPSLSAVPVVLISSSYVEEEDRQMAQSVGATAFLTRLMEPIELARELLAAIAHPPSPVAQRAQELDTYTQRLIRQLDRVTAINANLTQQVNLREAELSILAELGSTLSQDAPVDTLLQDLLHRVLAAARISKGAVVLRDEHGQLVLSGHLGFPPEAVPELVSLFGHADLLARAIVDGMPIVVPSSKVRADKAKSLLKRAAAEGVLITPIISGGERLGALFVVSEHGLVEQEWVLFANMVGNHMGQGVRLARSYAHLRRSEERYRSLVEGVPVGIFRSTPEGQLLEVNRAMVVMLGHPDRESLLAVNAHDFFVDPAERKEWAQSLEQKGFLHFENQLRRRDGSIIWVRGSAGVVRDSAGRVLYYEGTHEDITEAKLAQEALRKHEERWRALIENSSDAIALVDPRGTVLYASPSTTRISGYPIDEFVGHNVFEYIHPDDAPRAQAELAEVVKTPGTVRSAQIRVRTKAGAWRWFELSGMNLLAQPSVQAVVVNYRDVTDRRIAEEQLAKERNLLRTLVDTLPDFVTVKDVESRFVLVNKAYAAFLGQQTPSDLDGKSVRDVFPHELAAEYLADDQAVLRTGRALISQESRTVDRAQQVRWHSVSKVPLRNGSGELVGLVSIARDITDRKRDEEQIQRQLQTLTALYATAQKLSQSRDLDTLARYIVDTAVREFGARMAWIGRAEPDGATRLLAHWPRDHPYLRTIHPRWDDPVGAQRPSGRALLSGAPVVIQDIRAEASIPNRDALVKMGVTCAAAFPLISRDKPFGVLVLYGDQPDFLSPTRVEFFQTFANHAASALENARLFEETATQVQQLQALRHIDMAITASLDLRVTLNVVLDQATTQLKADATSILLLDARTQTLRSAVGRGFRSKTHQTTALRVGDGPAGRAALERQIVIVPDLAVEPPEVSRSPRFASEGFVAYVIAPLVAKGRVVGVLEVFRRSPLAATSEWLAFLEALSGQAAIAIDNADLFDNLQRANSDLVMAYDATIEGWSKALDLRDKETEGHTLRVTELTLHLARAMGVTDDLLVHVRRGALLHDIGKMGIPDTILLKPGPLSPEEWEIMRRHPVYAFELLASIPYLREALDIPYCHHEKWDGTGYPRKLRGTQIPLPARIFAIIDVFDALTSDRPYRSAWPKEKALAHIREQSGTHFDPDVVAAFLCLAEVAAATH
jgi:PAS domain S-box-containing protein/putative nucleotidyltransferase with HDIG domain